MFSTSTKYALKKRTLDRKSVSLARMKHSIKNLFPLAGKLLPLLGMEKIEENWFTPNLKNGVHQWKKALNKSTRFVIYRKSVSTSQNEGFVEKYDFNGPKNCFHSNQCLEKLKKTVYTSRNNVFLKYWPPTYCNNSLKKNARISFPLNRKSIVTGRDKGFV